MSPERLFKYTTADAVSKILGNQTLQWSSPIAFNDPFDMKNYFFVDFSWSDLKRDLFQKIHGMIQSPDAPVFDADNELVPTLEWMRTNLRGYPKGHIDMCLEGGMSEAFELCEKVVEEERKYWLEEIEMVRILCLAETPDNLLMWSHYAEQHAGVVLEFDTKVIEDSSSSQAIKVRYADVVPTPFTYQQYLDYLLGKRAFPDVSDYTRAVACSKSTDWSYEREWRFLRYDDHPVRGRYSYVPYPSDALLGVYFGSRIYSGKRESIISLLDGKYARGRIYKMREKAGRYELEIVPT
jgi:hypothetical protein